MPLIYTPDRRYLHAVTSADDPAADGNDVVYDLWSQPGQMVPCWDKFSYEWQLGQRGIVVTPPILPPVAPSPVPPPGPSAPVPTAGGSPVIRVTTEQDGEFINRGYSSNTQSWITGDLCYVFAGHRDLSPRFFRVDLASGSIERLGPLLGNRYRGEGEGIYWRKGWVYYIKGMELRRASPFAENDELAFTIEGMFPFPCDLWQTSSDQNGETHAATVRKVRENGDTEKVGTVVYWRSDVKYFPAHGDLDESQVDASGGWVLIKEDDRNRVIELATSITQTMDNAGGALGHSDMGAGFVIGEDDQRGECVFYDLRKLLVPERRRTLLKTWGLGHVSVQSGRCLRADETNLSLIAIDGSGEAVLGPHGMVSDGTYDTQVFASLDASGRVAAYLSNEYGRLDLFLRVLP